MTTNINEPEDWTAAAHEKGLQAWRDAEARLRASRSRADLAREPLPEEAAKLGELQASVDVAVSLVDAAKAKVAATLPPVVEGRARQAGGLLSQGPVATTDAYFASKQAMLGAIEAEGRARSRHTDYQMLCQAAGQARFARMSQKESA